MRSLTRTVAVDILQLTFGRLDALLSSHKPPEKAFTVDKLLAFCSSAPIPSQEYKLFSCVGCEVFSVCTIVQSRQAGQHRTDDWELVPPQQSYNSKAFSSSLWLWDSKLRRPSLS